MRLDVYHHYGGEDKILKALLTIKGDLKKIMATQEEFDAQITAANAKLDDLATAVTAEAQQIADFIAANPTVDTSALEGVVARLGEINVGGIFEPPA